MKKRGLKVEHQFQVLESVRQKGPLSRIDLSKQLKLSKPSISSLVDELLSLGYLKEMGKSESTARGGRRPIGLVFNPQNRYCLGVDIGGTKTLIVLTDLNGEEVVSQTCPTSKKVDDIIGIIQSFIDSSEVDRDRILGMGISLAGIVDSKNGTVVDSPNLNWEHVPLVQMLQRYFPFPIFINNDANCAIYAEKLKGHGLNSRNLVFVTVGTGVGAALIINDQLIEGHHFSAGEIGYLIDRVDVERSNFGSMGEFGPFEKRVSGKFLSETYGSSEQLFQDYYAGSARAKKIVNQFATDISIAIANIINIVNPEKVIIGGGVSRSMEGILDFIRKSVSGFTPMEVTIELSALGNNGCAIGAAAYTYNKIPEL